MKNRMQAQRGQSAVEYVIVAAFSVIVLIEGGSSAPVQEVITAMRNAYEGFTYALGFSTNLNIF